MRPPSRLLLAGVLAAACTPALAINLADDRPQAPARERDLTFHLRTYYLERDKPAGQSDLLASTVGGWIGYDSGWFFDRFKFVLTGYTSQKINAPADQDGTLLLKPGQMSYSVLGQSYASLKLWDEHKFNAGRQLVNQPEVNPQDNRMTPNTFEAYNFTGKGAGIDYFAGYVNKMKTRNSTTFLDMAAVAGAAPGVESEMWLGGLSYAPIKDLTLRYSGYRVQDILNSNYIDSVWLTPLSQEWKLRLGGNYMFQSSTGSNALNGSSFDTWSAGAKADFLYGGSAIRAGYTQTGSGFNYQSPYGTWGGYTSMVVTDFNRAGERAFLLEGSYDFTALNVPGLVITSYGVFGSKAINSTTRAAVSDKTEYNGTIDYRFNSGGWPDWLKPLWVRARATRVEEKFSGTAVTNDYRFIVNYEQHLNW